ELARPGGGIAPGASWRADGVSWTPSTSLLALALARAGEHGPATEILSWLTEHRTAEGSLPEKVLFDGRPAEAAPLAWTAANTVLALDCLARGCPSRPVPAAADPCGLFIRARQREGRPRAREIRRPRLRRCVRCGHEHCAELVRGQPRQLGRSRGAARGGGVRDRGAGAGSCPDHAGGRPGPRAARGSGRARRRASAVPSG